MGYEPHELKMVACRAAAHSYVDKMFDSESDEDAAAAHLMVKAEHGDYLKAKEVGEVMGGDDEGEDDES